MCVTRGGGGNQGEEIRDWDPTFIFPKQLQECQKKKHKKKKENSGLFVILIQNKNVTFFFGSKINNKNEKYSIFKGKYSVLNFEVSKIEYMQH